MLSSKSVAANKHDPTGPVRTIVSKSVVNIRNIPIKQKTKRDKQPEDRPRQIAVAAYYRVLLSVALRMAMKLPDWLEAEAEAD